MGVKANSKKRSLKERKPVAAVTEAATRSVDGVADEQQLAATTKSQQEVTSDVNRASVVSVTSDTSANSNTLAETCGSFFAVVGSLFSNLNCKKKGDLPKNFSKNKKKKKEKRVKQQSQHSSYAVISQKQTIPMEAIDNNNTEATCNNKKPTNFEALLSILYSSKDYVNKLNKNRNLNASQSLGGVHSEIRSTSKTPSSSTSGQSANFFKRLSTNSFSNKSGQDDHHVRHHQPHLANYLTSNNSISNNSKVATNRNSLNLVNMNRNSMNRNSMNRNSGYISDKIDFFLTNTNTNEILYNKDQSRSESCDLNSGQCTVAMSAALTMTNASNALSNQSNANNNNRELNAKKRQSGSFGIAATSKQTKQQNRLSKKSLEESFESIDQLNSKRKSVYSICSEDRSITIVHIKSGDHLYNNTYVSDNANNVLNNTNNTASGFLSTSDSNATAVSSGDNTAAILDLSRECPLTLEQLINQYETLIPLTASGANLTSSSSTATTTNRKSIIIIETNNSVHDQLIASILETSATVTTSSSNNAETTAKRNSRYLEETNQSSLNSIKRLSKSSRASTNSDASNNLLLNDQEENNRANEAQLVVSDEPLSELVKNAEVDNATLSEEEEPVLEGDDDNQIEQNNEDDDVDEDVNDEADEFYDDDEEELNKKNLFDIYNEYNNDLLSAEDAASGVVAVEAKQQQKSESAETSSDTSSGGTTQTSTSSSGAGGRSVGKVDDALSCKNNLELLTKELNKMLDDIETQKFIINDKEIYFLNRIQNFRLLEQIKEEDDELNDEYDEEDYEDDDYEDEEEEEDDDDEEDEDVDDNDEDEEYDEEDLKDPNIAIMQTNRYSKVRDAEEESKESAELFDDDELEFEDGGSFITTATGDNNQSGTNTTNTVMSNYSDLSNVTLNNSQTATSATSPATSPTPLLTDKKTVPSDTTNKPSSVASTVSTTSGSTSFSNGSTSSSAIESSSMYTLTPASSSASVLYSAATHAASTQPTSSILANKKHFHKNELKPLSESEELELMNESKLKLLKNSVEGSKTKRNLNNDTKNDSGIMTMASSSSDANVYRGSEHQTAMSSSAEFIQGTGSNVDVAATSSTGSLNMAVLNPPGAGKKLTKSSSSAAKNASKKKKKQALAAAAAAAANASIASSVSTSTSMANVNPKSPSSAKSSNKFNKKKFKLNQKNKVNINRHKMK